MCQLAIRMALWQYGTILYNNTPGYNVCTWYPELNAYQSDCLGFVRAVLCGWTGDKNSIAGGVPWQNYYCYGFDENTFLNTCQSTSNNFATLYSHPFALLQIPSSHVGLYVGDFEHAGFIYNSCECTPNGVMLHQGATPSWVDPDGTRRRCKNGAIAGRWENWGVFRTDGQYYPAYTYDGIGGGGIGASIYAIAAICGSWWGESKDNPGQWESGIVCSWDYIYDQQNPNKGGYGLAQWTNLATNAMLLQDMINWLTDNNFAPDSGEGQIKYFLEMNRWYDKPGNYNHYSNLADFLTTEETNLEHLVHDFLASHQGATQAQLDIAVPIRTQYAQDIYNFIQQHQNDPVTNWTWTARNGALTDAEAYANCMCIYWQLATGTYVEPEAPFPGVRVPSVFWMTLRHPRFYLNPRVNRKIK